MRTAPQTPLNLGVESFGFVSFSYQLILYKDYLCNMPSFVNSMLVKALCLAIQFYNTCMKLKELKFIFNLPSAVQFTSSPICLYVIYSVETLAMVS